MFDPTHPVLKPRIARGDLLAVSWLALGSAAVAEAAALAAPDAIVIDLQHGLWERRELEAAIGLVPSRVPVIVRVAENTPLAIGSALDAGAEAVMVPMVETAADAERAVRAAHYPPRGARSAGGVRPLRDFGAYVRGAEALVVIVMIETVAGLANAAAIAAVPGVDMVFIGTGDLALSMQIDEASRERHAQACDEILAACTAASVPCGLFTTSREAALAQAARGHRMVVAASDIEIVSGGFAEATAALRSSKQDDAKGRA